MRQKKVRKSTVQITQTCCLCLKKISHKPPRGQIEVNPKEEQPSKTLKDFYRLLKEINKNTKYLVKVNSVISVISVEFFIREE